MIVQAVLHAPLAGARHSKRQPCGEPEFKTRPGRILSLDYFARTPE
ncbi:MAG: hypothetical protein H8F28_25725 [Fibrella sp.]|nr:hypothetical protein [Armatimonadota bacterium]